MYKHRDKYENKEIK